MPVLFQGVSAKHSVDSNLCGGSLWARFYRWGNWGRVDEWLVQLSSYNWSWVLSSSPLCYLGNQMPEKRRLQKKEGARVKVTTRNVSSLSIPRDRRVFRRIWEGVACYRFSTDQWGGALNDWNGNIKSRWVSLGWSVWDPLFIFKIQTACKQLAWVILSQFRCSPYPCPLALGCRGIHTSRRYIHVV